MEAGKLIDEATGEGVGWTPARMVVPLSPALREHVDGPEYDARVEEAARALKLRVVADPAPAAP